MSLRSGGGIPLNVQDHRGCGGQISEFDRSRGKYSLSAKWLMAIDGLLLRCWVHRARGNRRKENNSLHRDVMLTRGLLINSVVCIWFVSFATL